MYVLAVSCIFTFATSTKRNHNICFFLSLSKYLYLLLPHPHLLTINKEKTEVWVKLEHFPT